MNSVYSITPDLSVSAAYITNFRVWSSILEPRPFLRSSSDREPDWPTSSIIKASLRDFTSSAEACTAMAVNAALQNLFA
jgi:hypothetical protein